MCGVNMTLARQPRRTRLAQSGAGQ